MDIEGHITQQQRLPNDPLVLQRFFETLEGPAQIILEAPGNWLAVYERIAPYVQQVVLAGDPCDQRAWGVLRPRHATTGSRAREIVTPSCR